MSNTNQYTLPFREAIPMLDTILGSKLDKKIFFAAFEALLEDAEEAGYIPQDKHKEKISMLQSLVEDRQVEDDDDVDDDLLIDDGDSDLLDDPEDLDDVDDLDDDFQDDENDDEIDTDAEEKSDEDDDS